MTSISRATNLFLFFWVFFPFSGFFYLYFFFNVQTTYTIFTFLDVWTLYMYFGCVDYDCASCGETRQAGRMAMGLIRVLLRLGLDFTLVCFEGCCSIPETSSVR